MKLVLIQEPKADDPVEEPVLSSTDNDVGKSDG